MKLTLGFFLSAFALVGLYKAINTDLYAQTTSIIAAAGDIVRSSSTGPHVQTSDLVIQINPNTVLALGDNSYPDGTLSTYNQYYNPSWGRFKSKTKPVPGNHEYHTSGAAGYFDYFGSLAGERGKGYYSYNVGSWHLIALNSEQDTGATGAQVTWLNNDLNANRNTACTLAYWHSPRWSSGQHGNNTRSAAFVDKLYQYKADIILAGHDHIYERLAPMNPQGQAVADGVREFVVGTGGAGLYSLSNSAPNSQFKTNQHHGVLKMTLNSNSYSWQFINISNQVIDSGSGNCVGGGSTSTNTPTPRTSATATPRPSATVTPGGTKPGDCGGPNGAPDNFVDLFDYGKLSRSFGLTQGQPGFEPLCDFRRDSNNIIDLFDYQILANNFGR